MSALDQLPDDVRAEIAAGTKRIREDLRIIPDAEAAGWTVTFRDDHWHNAATFERGGVSVWDASTGWRSATLEGGRFSKPTVHGFGMAKLRAALGLPETTQP
jgi:hypothetical protein